MSDGFPLTHIFPYIYDSVCIRENTGQGKPLFWHVSRSAILIIKISSPSKIKVDFTLF